jgi:hypothetical protein
MTTAASIQPSLADLFTPKLVTALREGYGADDLRRDAIAGLTVAIVALPLSMAIAIASGTTPDRGLVTAVIGGPPGPSFRWSPPRSLSMAMTASPSPPSWPA